MNSLTNLAELLSLSESMHFHQAWKKGWNAMMEYNGYTARVNFDDEAGVFFGEVVNLRDVITFQGETVAEVRQAFKDSVDDYIAFCKERGEDPEKPYSGQFVVRLEPSLHRDISTVAKLQGKSLNAWVSERLAHDVRKMLRAG